MARKIVKWDDLRARKMFLIKRYDSLHCPKCHHQFIKTDSSASLVEEILTADDQLAEKARNHHLYTVEEKTLHGVDALAYQKDCVSGIKEMLEIEQLLGSTDVDDRVEAQEKKDCSPKTEGG